MGIWFDLALILVLLIAIIVGYKKGIFSVVKRFRMILSVFLAWQLKLTAPVKGIVGKIFRIDKDYFTEKVDAKFGEKLSEGLQSSEMSAEEVFNSTFGKLGNLLSGIKDSLIEKISSGAENAVSEVTELVANSVYDLIFGLIGFVFLFIIFFVLFTVLYHIINKILNIGVLGLINRILGGVFGAVTGVIWMWLLAIVFVKLLPLFLPFTAENIAGGPLGTVRWFINSFFLSGIFGFTPIP